MRPLPRDEVLAARNDELASYVERPLQVGMRGDPWRVVVASVLLNRTSHVQVRPVLAELLSRWPGPAELAAADAVDVTDVVAPCGFGDRRGRGLVALARAWVAGAWNDARELPHVGPYVADCVGLFCFGDVELASTDRRLVDHVKSLLWEKNLKES